MEEHVLFVRVVMVTKDICNIITRKYKNIVITILMHLSLIFSIFPGCFNSSLLEPMKMVLPSLHPVAACFDYCDNTSRIGLTVSVRVYLCTPKIIIRLREYIEINLHVSSIHVVYVKVNVH